LWAGFVAWLRTAGGTSQTGKSVSSALNAALDSKTARYLGTRSYSTYLIHEPIIYSIVFLCIKRFSLGLLPTLFITLLFTVASTLVASAVLYRVVEAPAIAFGKRLFTAGG
jgi:peptidoglycan/LPS O-acetylase OafA/YrhL